VLGCLDEVLLIGRNGSLPYHLSVRPSVCTLYALNSGQNAVEKSVWTFPGAAGVAIFSTKG